jgi:hypothetical protein
VWFTAKLANTFGVTPLFALRLSFPRTFVAHSQPNKVNPLGTGAEKPLTFSVVAANMLRYSETVSHCLEENEPAGPDNPVYPTRRSTQQLVNNSHRRGKYEGLYPPRQA